MGTWLNNHPHLTAAVAAISVIAVGIGTMFILVLLGSPSLWIVILTSVIAIATAGAFFYVARNSRKAKNNAEISALSEGLDIVDNPHVGLESEPAPIDSSASIVSKTNAAASEPSEDSTPMVEEDHDVSLPSTYAAESPASAAPEIRETIPVKSSEEAPEAVDSNYSAETAPVIDEEGTAESAAAVGKLMDELENKIEQQETVIVSADRTSAISKEASAMTEDVIESSSVEVVDRTKQQIRKSGQQCIIISAPSPGILQDRLNNWLSGGAGRVVHASMTSDQRGFYLTIFYEPL